MNKYNKYLTRRIDKNKNLNSLLEYPSYIEIETVNACNARCPMCTINDWKRNYPVMRDSVFSKISDDLIDNKKYISGERINYPNIVSATTYTSTDVQTNNDLATILTTLSNNIASLSTALNAIHNKNVLNEGTD